MLSGTSATMSYSLGDETLLGTTRFRRVGSYHKATRAHSNCLSPFRGTDTESCLGLGGSFAHDRGRARTSSV
jgi:hypothetical protein